jgi:hypothetical protein
MARRRRPLPSPPGSHGRSQGMTDLIFLALDLGGFAAFDLAVRLLGRG